LKGGTKRRRAWGTPDIMCGEGKGLLDSGRLSEGKKNGTGREKKLGQDGSYHERYSREMTAHRVIRGGNEASTAFNLLWPTKVTSRLCTFQMNGEGRRVGSWAICNAGALEKKLANGKERGGCVERSSTRSMQRATNARRKSQLDQWFRKGIPQKEKKNHPENSSSDRI